MKHGSSREGGDGPLTCRGSHHGQTVRPVSAVVDSASAEASTFDPVSISDDAKTRVADSIPTGETAVACGTQRSHDGDHPPRGLRDLLHLSKYGLGVFLILCVTVIWVASSEWIQYIFGALEFNKPYFLTYFNTTGFCFWNAGYLVSSSWRRTPLNDSEDNSEDGVVIEADTGTVDEPAHEGAREEMSSSHGDQYPSSPLRVSTVMKPREELEGQESDTVHRVAQAHPTYGGVANPPLTTEAVAERKERDIGRTFSDNADLEATKERGAEADVATMHASGDTEEDATGDVQPYSLRRIWRCAAWFCPFWFLANYLFNLSLSITSVASNTILSSTSSIWTLLLSYVILKQAVGVQKWVAVCVCVTGTSMVALSDRGNDSGSGDEGGGNSGSVGGDAVALVSAFFYATYTTILKRGLPDDERYAMGMVFGAVGVLNLVCLWPGLVILNGAGLEHFAWPSAAQFWPLALNALIGTNLSDVLWARSVVLTSPVVATLGLSLTTPLAMVVDALFKGQTFSALYVFGAVLVMAGFVLANVDLF